MGEKAAQGTNNIIHHAKIGMPDLTGRAMQTCATRSRSPVDILVLDQAGVIFLGAGALLFFACLVRVFRY